MGWGFSKKKEKLGFFKVHLVLLFIYRVFNVIDFKKVTAGRKTQKPKLRIDSEELPWSFIQIHDL